MYAFDNSFERPEYKEYLFWKKKRYQFPQILVRKTIILMCMDSQSERANLKTVKTNRLKQ